MTDLTRLVERVTEQEKKYGERLVPRSDFYRRHLMVKHFLQIQLQTQFNQARYNLSLQIAQSFRKGRSTARNIICWENSWVEDRNSSSVQDREDYFSRIDEENVQWESLPEKKETVSNFMELISQDEINKYFYEI